MMHVFRLKRRFLILCCVIFAAFAVCLNTFAQEEPARPQIILDAGHGGIDPGAVSASGIAEKDINLHIAQKLAVLLRTAGFEVILTRDSDISLHDAQYTAVRQIKTSDLKNRLRLFNEHPDALVISIHQNQFAQAKYRGAQMFAGPNNPESQKLAESLQSAVKTHLQPENTRAPKTATKDVYIIYHAKNPAVLAECGFLSNPEEAALLNTDGYQTQMALALFEGILRYYQEK